MELEQEFEYYAAKSKIDLVEAKIIDYYRTIEQDEVNLSGAFYESPEQRARKDIINLIKFNIPKFERLYKLAYAELPMN